MTHTIVWKKLMVGNIHEKKPSVKNFVLTDYKPLQTALFLCVKKIFVCLTDFRRTWHPTKIFSCRIFPKLW